MPDLIWDVDSHGPVPPGLETYYTVIPKAPFTLTNTSGPDEPDEKTIADVINTGRLSQASQSAAYVGRSGPAFRLRPIANGVHLPVRNAAPNNLSDGVATGITTQMQHTVVVAAKGIRFAFGNWYDNNGGETDGTNDIVVKASIRWSTTNWFPVYFGGKRSVTIEPGAVILSDPVGINFAAGATFASRTFVSVTAGGKYPLGTKTNGSNVEGVTTTDVTGAADVSLVNSTYGYAPWAILGTTATSLSSPVLLTVGDSITVGYGDLNQSSDSFGWTRRALDGHLSYVNLGISGSSAAGADTTAEIRRRFALGDAAAPDAETAIVLYGTNDLPGAATAQNVQDSLLAIYTILKDRGMKVYGATIPPITTSTDAWATTANQTVLASNSKRIVVNAWIRTVPTPLTGIFEFADAVESARDSGIWKAAHSADGTHPNATGHTAMGALINPATFGSILA